MNINTLFDLMDDWRFLPAYQLERRADLFFALHLNGILKEKFGAKIDMIIPEFPLRVGEIFSERKKPNQSFKIDYLAYSKNQNKVYLIELKTDQGSRRSEQDQYLIEAEELGINVIVNGLIKIFKATRQKRKYDHLLDKIESIGWITREDGKINSNNVNIEIEVIYIQPINEDKKDNIISFDNIIQYFSDSDDPITIRFTESLEKWKLDSN